MPTTLIANVDAWADQIDIKRSEAIRRLVELGLTVKAPAKPATKPGRRLRAQELATKAIENIIDPAARRTSSAQTPPHQGLERVSRRPGRSAKGKEEMTEATKCPING